MPRIARIVLPGLPHHITQRGSNRQDVFFTDDDRRFYLSVLGEQSEKFGLKINAYCLMTNHVHFVVVPGNEAALGKAMGRANLIYAQYINRLHGRSGHLWQNRFYSCPMSDEHYMAAMVYVERNPVRARMVSRAWDYGWSSALDHVEGDDRAGILDVERWRVLKKSVDWRKELGRPDDDDFVARLKLSRNRGRPLAEDSFLAKLEKTLGRRLRPQPVGRPKKRKNAKKAKNR